MASQLTWHGPDFVDNEAAVYLTFDDGPHPVITRVEGVKSLVSLKSVKSVS